MEPEKVVDGRSSVITLYRQRHTHTIKCSMCSRDILSCQVGQKLQRFPDHIFLWPGPRTKRHGLLGPLSSLPDPCTDFSRSHEFSLVLSSGLSTPLIKPGPASHIPAIYTLIGFETLDFIKVTFSDNESLAVWVDFASLARKTNNPFSK